MKYIIEARNITKHYTLGKTSIMALKGVDFMVREGEIICLMGPSGSGKTTLLNVISCIDDFDEGRLNIAGNDMQKKNDNFLAEFRNKTMGFIFQTFNLIPVLNTFENVEYPLIIKKVRKSERKKLVNAIIKAVGLEQFKKHRPDELSGGQRQRVAIARALVTRPKIVFADEPTSALDHKTGEDILNIIEKINQVYKTTFIFSTHDSLFSQHAHRIVKLFDGKIQNNEGLRRK